MLPAALVQHAFPSSPKSTAACSGDMQCEGSPADSGSIALSILNLDWVSVSLFHACSFYARLVLSAVLENTAQQNPPRSSSW